VKTWRCFIPGWPEVTYEIKAETRGEALYTYWLMGQEAGYDLKFTELRARNVTEATP